MVAPNWANQTIWTGDCLEVMRGMNSATVDLIYLDPPFNSKTDYAAPIGSVAAGAEFKDTWTLSDLDAEWINLIEGKHPQVWRVLMAAMTPSDKSYLAYMTPRLLEMRRVLAETGSLYLHCDPTMSHYLKLLLDAIFGPSTFRNEIVWSYRRWPSKQPNFQRMHDIILRYSPSAKPTFNVQYEPPSASYLKRFKGKTQVLDPDSGTRKLVVDEPTKGMPLRDVWDISIVAGSSKERVGYPTQKPLALLDRIIAVSSNAGDVVLDPFCGCATACIAAEQLGRKWAGIDISPKAAELVAMRMRDQLGLFYDGTHRTDIPQRTDLGPLPAYNCEANRKHLYGEQGGHCAGCSEHFQARHFEVDHIIAKSKGGTDHLTNLQLLCSNCNRIKGDRGMEYLRTKLELAA